MRASSTVAVTVAGQARRDRACKLLSKGCGRERRRSTAGGGLQMVFVNALQQVVFVGLFGGALLLEIAVWLTRRPRMQFGWLIAALVTFALAAATWLADAQLPCDPTSLFQWHGLWHALTATAAGFVFLYYRSEEAKI